MRPIFSVAVLSSVLIVLPSAFAQRGSFGGGHAGGFAGHSAGGGFVSHFSGPAFSGPGRMPGFPMHSIGPAPRMSFTAPTGAFAARMGSGVTADRNRGWGNGRHRPPYRPPYRGYGYGVYPYAYANSWELLPWDVGYSDFGYDDDDDAGSNAAQQPANQAVTQPDQSYGPAYAQGYGPAYPPEDQGYLPGYNGQPYSDYAPPPPQEEAAIAPEPALTLIFKDGHQRSIQNYVLTQQAVIVMESSGRQHQIPLADLNLPATEQAAQQAGLDFAPPA